MVFRRSPAPSSCGKRRNTRRCQSGCRLRPALGRQRAQSPRPSHRPSHRRPPGRGPGPRRPQRPRTAQQVLRNRCLMPWPSGVASIMRSSPGPGLRTRTMRPSSSAGDPAAAEGVDTCGPCLGFKGRGGGSGWVTGARRRFLRWEWRACRAMVSGPCAKEERYWGWVRGE
ncbi:hypothetical protein OBBRIDRAFT_342626 [Obba rivulosa]|uniref:Uncharacterized protein n=1 Tax=Obba rivulosa TaxID=1052685 RepID=A0A8E2DEN8_9APHY|nr:hypothetical protein OBBRIDRAFT_342626 [Obba rivulosa]